ncbi:hypothetical protein P4G43_05435 [Shigella boydii]|nr:hypothetical protein [Shigella boydii]
MAIDQIAQSGLSSLKVIYYSAQLFSRMAEDLAALNAPVPAEFWAEMRRQNLVAENAPLPTR